MSTTSERSMQLRYAAHLSWANTPDRSARTAAARKASHHTRFLSKARQLHPGATEEQITEIANSLRSAHFTGLALKSVAARRAKKELQAAKERQQRADFLAEMQARAARRRPAA
ncbi:hypothetical protein [Streptomyces uncialis]|uniref:hypothetical protein n=1 Tax=Streptomyces uncialis TaxID=1048205 RepID=UPI0033F2DC9B